MKVQKIQQPNGAHWALHKSQNVQFCLTCGKICVCFFVIGFDVVAYIAQHWRGNTEWHFQNIKIDSMHRIQISNSKQFKCMIYSSVFLQPPKKWGRSIWHSEFHLNDNQFNQFFSTGSFKKKYRKRYNLNERLTKDWRKTHKNIFINSRNLFQKRFQGFFFLIECLHYVHYTRHLV